MVDEPSDAERQARIAEVEARRVPVGEVARWFAPWILAGVLLIVFLAGLWCASAATDDGTYAVGLAAAGLALAALVWELATALGGGLGSLSARLLVEDETSLVVLVVLLSALALGGLVLAARGASVAASGAGYGLCLFGIAFVFANLKHYFDRRERF
jgi:hypothetical protein